MKDVKLEIANDILTIRGENKHEKEEKDKNFHRVERSYGSFQRVLSLPEDADQDAVKATFKRGILTISMPRKAMPQADVRKIEITCLKLQVTHMSVTNLYGQNEGDLAMIYEKNS